MALVAGRYGAYLPDLRHPSSSRLVNGNVTVEVAHRQADGTWLWVLDQPNILG